VTRTYGYDAEILRWVDGDTVWLDVDLGLRTHVETEFRLLGVDTPEHGKPGFHEAVEAVNGWAPVGSTIDLVSFRPDKYGRWLASITAAGNVPVNDLLVSSKLAVPYFGGKK
jgi:micrococcal nuclease